MCSWIGGEALLVRPNRGGLGPKQNLANPGSALRRRAPGLVSARRRPDLERKPDTPNATCAYHPLEHESETPHIRVGRCARNSEKSSDVRFSIVHCLPVLRRSGAVSEFRMEHNQR